MASASTLPEGHRWPNRLHCAEEIPARSPAPSSSEYCCRSLRARRRNSWAPTLAVSLQVLKPKRALLSASPAGGRGSVWGAAGDRRSSDETRENLGAKRYYSDIAVKTDFSREKRPCCCVLRTVTRSSRLWRILDRAYNESADEPSSRRIPLHPGHRSKHRPCRSAGDLDPRLPIHLRHGRQKWAWIR